MYPNMMNPIGPMMSPWQMAVPQVQPVTIKIDIAPNMMPQVAVENKGEGKEQQKGVIYNMPKASLYSPKEENKANEEKAVEKKTEDKKTETTMAQALAAQVGIQPPQATQAKAAEVAPKNDKAETKEVKHNKPEIVKPELMKTGIDINGLISILTSKDYDEQADAMEAISEVTMYAPERANELLDNKVVDNLLEIMDKDTSKLEGKDKALAERNKEYAMFTTATLQKLYSDQVKELGNVTVPTDDLIGMAGIVKNLKTNSNASVREAAVASLGYMTKPEYKNDLGKLIKEATNDVDKNVQAQANKQLSQMA